MVDVEQLLTPVSEDAPCGEDLSYDADLSTLETLIQGKAETQFSAAEEPNWKEVQKTALALAERTKDLRVTINLTLAALQLDGWSGFAQGVALLRGLHERYWDNFYPRLDPDDDNDPTERANLLATLAAPEGTFGDPMRFLERLRAAPLCRGSRLGPLSLAAITATKAGGGDGEDAKPVPALEPAAIEAAFRDTPAEFLTEIRGAVTGATAEVAAIENFWDETVGAGVGPNLEALRTVLRDAKSRLDAYAPVMDEDGGTTDLDGDLDTAGLDDDLLAAETPTRSRATAGGGGAPGEITSREDVIASLEAICAYYDEREPSSPLPALLRQARRMVGMNYFQIMSTLTPDATPQVRLAAEEDGLGTLAE